MGWSGGGMCEWGGGVEGECVSGMEEWRGNVSGVE